MKNYNIRPVNEWHTIVFASPHKIIKVGYVKNINLKPLMVGWLSMWWCIKVQFEQPFFSGSVSEIMKTVNWRDFILTLIAVTRIINLIKCISQFKFFNFQYTSFISDLHYFLRSKSSAEMNNIRKAWRTGRLSVVKPGG